MRAAVLDPSPATQPIRNRCKFPQPTGTAWGTTGWGTGGAGSMSFASTGGPRNNATAVQTWTTLPAAGQAGGTIVSTGAGGVTQDADAVPGQTYTGVIRAKLGAALPLCCDLTFYDAAGVVLLPVRPAAVVAASGVWEVRTATGVAPANTARVRVGGRVTLMDGAPAGLVNNYTDAMLFLGPSVPPVYVDGDSPGWRWTGTARASESVGWPYALDNVMGRPLGDLAGSGSVALNQPLSTDPLTVYLVADKLADQGGWPEAAGVNVSGTGFGAMPNGLGIWQVGTPGALLRWQYRLDTSGGTNQAAGVQVTSLGRHVYAVRAILTGALDRSSWHDGVKQSGPTATPASTGVEARTLAANVATAAWSPVRTLVYRQAHTDADVARVTAWLARTYGTPIPPGY